MAVFFGDFHGEVEPPVASPTAANPGKSQTIWVRQNNLPRFFTGLPEDRWRPRMCFLLGETPCQG